MPKRPGSKPSLSVPSTDPLEFLRALMADPRADPELRVRAARAALPYVHETTRRRSKRDKHEVAADRAARELPPGRAPALAVVKKAK